MKITFLGTGAAEGFPAVFCNCQNCINVRKLGLAEFRSRSQVLINDDLSVDFPPDAYGHSMRFNIEFAKLKYLLVTHSHMDHFYAHDFILRGYKYAQLCEDKLAIFGNEEICKVYDECTKREMKPEVVDHLSVNKIKPFQSFEIGDYRVLTIPAQHCKNEEALLFYIEQGGKGYLQLYDTGAVSDEAIEFLAKNNAKVDVVAYDCTFAGVSNGRSLRHLSVVEDVEIGNRLKKVGVTTDKTLSIITHFSHNSNPLRKNLKELEDKYNMIAAYDGMVIEV